MEIAVDLDKIEDPIKRQWLVDSLKLMDIDFYLAERPQTLDEYNEDLERGSAEIERGEFITAEELKKLSQTW